MVMVISMLIQMVLNQIVLMQLIYANSVTGMLLDMDQTTPGTYIVFF